MPCFRFEVVKNARRRLKIIIIFTESPNTAGPRTSPRAATSAYKHERRPTGGTLNPVLFLFVCLPINNTGHAPRVSPARRRLDWLVGFSWSVFVSRRRNHNVAHSRPTRISHTYHIFTSFKNLKNGFASAKFTSWKKFKKVTIEDFIGVWQLLWGSIRGATVLRRLLIEIENFSHK